MSHLPLALAVLPLLACASAPASLPASLDPSNPDAPEGQVVGATALSTATPPAASAPKPKFFCPMHPQVVSDAPGICPLCNMRLVPTEEPATDAGSPPPHHHHHGHGGSR